MGYNRKTTIMKRLILYILLFLLSIGVYGQRAGVIASSQWASTPSTLLTTIVSAWDCNETSGTIVDAVSGYNSTTNTSTYSNTGKNGTALGYATTEITTIGDQTAWGTTTSTDLSISAWIYLTSTPTNTFLNIIGNYDGPQLALKKIATSYAIYWYPGGDAIEGTELSWSTGTWYHIMMVKTGSSVAFYRDNVAAGTGTENANATHKVIYLGNDQSSEVFPGRLDMIRWWGKALSSSERTELYTKENAGTTYPWGAYSSQNYYIKTGGNDSNTGLDDAHAWAHHPWMSTWTGSVTLTPGSTVLMNRGDTWTISNPSAAYMIVGQSGSAVLPITTTAYGNGAKPVIKITAGVTYPVIKGLGKSFVTFDNLDIQNSSATLNSNYNASGIIFGKDVSSNLPHDWLITNCDIHNCPRSGIEGLDDAYNITLGNINASSTATTTVYSNQIYDCGYAGILLCGRNPSGNRSDFNVYYNYLHGNFGEVGMTFSSEDINGSGPGYSTGWPEYCMAKYNYVTGVPLHTGIDTHGGQYISILDNYIIDCRIGIQADASSRTYAETAILDYVYVENNIIENTGAAAVSNHIFIAMIGESSSHRVTHGTVNNNNCFYTTRPADESYAFGIMLYNDDGITIDGNHIYNGPTGGEYGICNSSSGLVKNITVINNTITNWGTGLVVQNDYVDGTITNSGNTITP
jgi:hypothetical protein